MPLQEEVTQARKVIVKDGYDMSVGELVSMFRDKELVIDPAYQRFFRWDLSQKTRFIETLLLGIPIPPIFVFTREDGKWELVDGLQRVSTILQFMGLLDEYIEGESVPLTLDGTRLLPSLSGVHWMDSSENINDGLPQSLQIEIKRVRLRVEILKSESDPRAKYELFQRLNTGGSILSPQEVRNCILVQINKQFYDWLLELVDFSEFKSSISQTDAAEKKRQDLELALRFFVYRLVDYTPGLDVHEYLDQGMVSLAERSNFPYAQEAQIFRDTFAFLHNSLQGNAFKRWDGGRFIGKFLISVFEVLAVGVAKNIEAYRGMEVDARNRLLEDKSIRIWSETTFIQNSGPGIRGTTRLAKLLSIAEEFCRP